MDISKITQELFSRFKAENLQGRIIAIHHLSDLQEGIEGPHKQGLLDEDFFRHRLGFFQFNPPEKLPQARSIIVVAIPHPQTQFAFTWKGQKISLGVPPTYLHGREINRQAESLLGEILAQYGYQISSALLPLKLLAARSGLSRYGKNNISYVDGIGSFYRLAAFYSDIPCQEDTWQEAQMMEQCKQCSACQKACPTGAIGGDRFLLHAERCLSYHNEMPSDITFPAWIDPSWHNSLVGCMLCQSICPLNKKCHNWVEQGAEFTDEETLLLLQKTPLSQLSSHLVKKLEQDDLTSLFEETPRNLAAILVQKDIKIEISKTRANLPSK